MKKFLTILFTGITIGSKATDQVPITNNTMISIVGDSFEYSQFGNRSSFVISSYFINYYSYKYFISWRDHSRSGASNLGFVTDQMPLFCIPDAYTTHNNTNYFIITYASGNGGYNSNLCFTNLTIAQSFPTTNYSQNNVFTNDGFSCKVGFAFIGDLPYYTPDGHATYSYSGGARVAAANSSLTIPWADSWNNLSNFVMGYNGGYPANSNLFFSNSGVYDHPLNELHAAWAFTTLTNWQVDSNAFTCIADWTTTNGWTTNHCSAKNMAVGSSLSFILHADRQGPSYYAPDGTTTNDMRHVWVDLPQLGNTFCEIIRVQNIPAGNYVVSTGIRSFVTTSTQLAAGFNMWTNQTNPWFDHGMKILYDLCDMRDVSHIDSTTAAHTAPGKLLAQYESQCRGSWPGNPIGTLLYATNTLVVARESDLQAQDIIMNTDAQPFDVQVTIEPLAPSLPYVGR